MKPPPNPDDEIRDKVFDLYVYDQEPTLQSEVYKVVDLLLRVAAVDPAL